MTQDINSYHQLKVRAADPDLTSDDEIVLYASYLAKDFYTGETEDTPKKIVYLLTNDINLMGKAGGSRILAGNIKDLNDYLKFGAIGDPKDNLNFNKIASDNLDSTNLTLYDITENDDMEVDVEPYLIRMDEIKSLDFTSPNNFFYQICHMFLENFLVTKMKQGFSKSWKNKLRSCSYRNF